MKRFDYMGGHADLSGVQPGIDIGVLPDGVSFAVFSEKDILPQMGLPRKSQPFQQPPGAGIDRVAFGKNPVYAVIKRLPSQAKAAFLRIALSPAASMKNEAELERIKFPFSQIDVSNHLAAAFKFDGNHFLRLDSPFEVFSGLL